MGLPNFDLLNFVCHCTKSYIVYIIVKALECVTAGISIVDANFT